jgi:hypothetical protein
MRIVSGHDRLNVSYDFNRAAPAVSEAVESQPRAINHRFSVKKKKNV